MWREKKRRRSISCFCLSDLDFLWFLWLFYSFLHLSGFNQLPFHPLLRASLTAFCHQFWKKSQFECLSLMFIKISPKTGFKSSSFVDKANPIIGWTFKPWQTIDDRLLGKSSMPAVTKGVFLSTAVVKPCDFWARCARGGGRRATVALKEEPRRSHLSTIPSTNLGLNGLV